MSNIASMYRAIQINERLRKLHEDGIVLTPALLIQIEDDVEAKLEEIQGIPSDYNDSISGDEGG